MNSNYQLPLFMFLFSISVQGDDKREALCTTLDGENNGFCIDLTIQLKFCPSLHGLLKNRNFAQLRQAICSADNTRVCCPSDEYNENLTFEPEPHYTKHPNFHLFPLKNCGQSVTQERILGGNTSYPGELPFMARIGVRPVDDDGTADISYICGGSLINRRYVLTAAHCFKSEHHKLVEIVLGQTDDRKNEECIQVGGQDGQLMNVTCAKPIRVGYEALILHPGYNLRVGSAHDIALIRLDRDINITSLFARPICLPFLEEYHVEEKLGEAKILRQDTMVAGWGKVNNVNIVGSSTLQFVRAPVQPHILCRVTFGMFNVTEKQLCAGGVKGQDSCLGDSGGPLYLPATPGKASSTRALRTFQLGIVSYGKTKCGKGNEPVVYTRVRSYLKWILDHVRD